MQCTGTQLQALTCSSGGGDVSKASLNSRSRRLRKKISKSSRRRRAVLRIASAAQSLTQNLGQLQLPAEPEVEWQQSTWNALTSRLSRGLHRQRAEDHLPLCKAFGVTSLEELRVRTTVQLRPCHVTLYLHCAL